MGKEKTEFRAAIGLIDSVMIWRMKMPEAKDFTRAELEALLGVKYLLAWGWNLFVGVHVLVRVPGVFQILVTIAILCGSLLLSREYMGNRKNMGFGRHGHRTP